MTETSGFLFVCFISVSSRLGGTHQIRFYRITLNLFLLSFLLPLWVQVPLAGWLWGPAEGQVSRGWLLDRIAVAGELVILDGIGIAAVGVDKRLTHGGNRLIQADTRVGVELK